MNCTDVAAVIDEHREVRLTTAERCALDDHLGGCEPCALAWRAQMALAALPVPSTRASLLDDVLRAVQRSGTTAHAPRRAAHARILFAGALLAAGAALAAVSYVAWDEAREDNSVQTVPAARDAAAPDTSLRETSRAAESGFASAEATTPAVPIAEVEPFLVARPPPKYPSAALERRLEGFVQVEYTVARNGAVEEVKVVTSSDAVFESAAAEAVLRWRYLPRVVAGERVAVQGVQTMVRFQLAPAPAEGEPAKRDPGLRPSDGEAARAFLAFERGLEVAWQRFAADDLRGAELELDELRATYEVASRDGRVWSFYGYIFTQYGDYGRAIAAYENALARYEKLPGGVWQGEQLALANLYFARHEYAMALKTLLKYRVTEDRRSLSTGIETLIEKLRALGVSEETL
jgi:TonB family protein